MSPFCYLFSEEVQLVIPIVCLFLLYSLSLLVECGYASQFSWKSIVFYYVHVALEISPFRLGFVFINRL
jgi:hypothetical protein